MTLLKDLWYGNIRPVEQSTPRTREYKKLMQEANDIMVKLQNELTPAGKQLLESYCNTHGMLVCLSEENAFVYGVRLGTGFILDMMEGLSFSQDTE